MPSGPAADQFGAIINEKVSRLETQSKTNSQKNSIPNSRIRRGIISADNGDGSYTVSVVGADSSTSQFTIDGVRPWDSTSSFTVGGKVTLLYEGNRPLPWILSGGSSGGEGGTTSLVVGRIRFFSS